MLGNRVFALSRAAGAHLLNPREPSAFFIDLDDEAGTIELQAPNLPHVLAFQKAGPWIIRQVEPVRRSRAANAIPPRIANVPSHPLTRHR